MPDPIVVQPLAFLRAAALLCASVVSGCVSVRIEGPDGGVRVVRSVGLVMIDVAQPRTAVTGSISGVGIIQAPLGWSAGFTRQRWALLGRECRAVIWPPPGGLDEETRAAIGRTAGVCLMADDPPAVDVAASAGAKP